MTIQRIVELLEIEHECILRAGHDDCDRNCADCDLVQDDWELHEMYTDVIALSKEQEAVKQKMWNALYEEEDKLEKKYAGTKENDNWFLVYRPWLQRGFEIAIDIIAKQERR